MSVMLQCIGCRRTKQFAGETKYPLCLRCEEWEIKHFKELHEDSDSPKKRVAKTKEDETICRLCGYEGPAIDHHHIHGKKISDEIIIVCANCHRELHAGVRVLNV